VINGTSNNAAEAGKASEKNSLPKCDARECQDAWAAAVLFCVVIVFAVAPTLSTLCRILGEVGK
jgi:hypothetical protein